MAISARFGGPITAQTRGIRELESFKSVRNGGYYIDWETGADLSADTLFSEGNDPKSESMGTKHIKIVVRDGIDEGHLMMHLVYIIEGDRFHDQFPHRKEGTFIRSFVLDCHNDWVAALVRKGERLRINEPPVENDTLCMWHRYQIEPLMAIKPWLQYLFSPKTNL